MARPSLGPTSYNFLRDFFFFAPSYSDRNGMETNKRLDDFRKHKDEYFASGAHSPLDSQDQDGFSGLTYFPFDPALKFELDIDTAEDQGTPLTLDTSDGQQVEFLIAGQVRFQVGKSKYALTLLKDYRPRPLFSSIPRCDERPATYKGGRYLDPQQKPNGELIIDFNYAYNPYCAYGEGWSCPLPPARNSLTIEIPAGEKTFHPEQD